MFKRIDPKAGQVWWCQLEEFNGDGRTEAKGARPCLVISSAAHNVLMNSCIVVPLTTKFSKSNWIEHVKVQIVGEDRPSIAMTEHVRELDKSAFIHLMSTISEEDYKSVMSTMMNDTLRKEL